MYLVTFVPSIGTVSLAAIKHVILLLVLLLPVTSKEIVESTVE